MIKHTTATLLAGTLTVLSGCYLFDALPEYDGPPCDPITDLTTPAYLCETTERGVLFLDPAAGDDTALASRSAPVASLSRALELAASNPEVVAILVSGAPELDVTGLSISQKTSLLAGYSADWRQDASMRPTLTTAGPLRLVGGDDAGEVVVLRGFDLEVAPSIDGATVGMLIDRQDVRLLDVTVTVGDAGDGAAGGDAMESGTPGLPGGDGGMGARVDAGVSGKNDADPQAEGGAGGRGGDAQGDAMAGEGSVLGAPGGAVGNNGENGQDGEQGAPGENATPGSWSSDGWTQGTPAMVGGLGAPGQGGGGGGGGAASGGQGGGGGGGGAGGAGGLGGDAGTSGFPSAGIVTIEARVELVSSTVRAGAGGDAGRGGAGSSGGEGAVGGAGRTGVNGGASGGRGGRGGHGGQGGTGGDGVAGTSYGVVCLEASLMENDSTVEAGTPGRLGETPADAARTLGCD